MNPSPSSQPAVDRILTAGAISIWLGACALQPASPTSLPATVVATATAPILFPTFAPTSTRTPAPTMSPTPDVLAELGSVILLDRFDSNGGWPLGEAPSGATSLQNGQLVLAVRQSREFRMALRETPQLGDFYLEVQVSTDLCSTGDEFGVVFRVNSLGEHYRYTLSCEGTIRVRRVLVDGSRALVSPAVNPAAFVGAPALNRMGIWASHDRFRFFVNGVEILQARDGTLIAGQVGFYVRASRDGQTTASFDELLVRALGGTP